MSELDNLTGDGGLIFLFLIVFFTSSDMIKCSRNKKKYETYKTQFEHFEFNAIQMSLLQACYRCIVNIEYVYWSEVHKYTLRRDCNESYNLRYRILRYSNTITIAI